MRNGDLKHSIGGRGRSQRGAHRQISFQDESATVIWMRSGGARAHTSRAGPNRCGCGNLQRIAGQKRQHGERGCLCNRNMSKGSEPQSAAGKYQNIADRRRPEGRNITPARTAKKKCDRRRRRRICEQKPSRRTKQMRHAGRGRGGRKYRQSRRSLSQICGKSRYSHPWAQQQAKHQYRKRSQRKRNRRKKQWQGDMRANRCKGAPGKHDSRVAQPRRRPGKCRCPRACFGINRRCRHLAHRVLAPAPAASPQPAQSRHLRFNFGLLRRLACRGSLSLKPVALQPDVTGHSCGRKQQCSQ